MIVVITISTNNLSSNNNTNNNSSNNKKYSDALARVRGRARMQTRACVTIPTNQTAIRKTEQNYKTCA